MNTPVCQSVSWSRMFFTASFPMDGPEMALTKLRGGMLGRSRNRGSSLEVRSLSQNRGLYLKACHGVCLKEGWQVTTTLVPFSSLGPHDCCWRVNKQLRLEESGVWGKTKNTRSNSLQGRPSLWLWKAICLSLSRLVMSHTHV